MMKHINKIEEEKVDVCVCVFESEKKKNRFTGENHFYRHRRASRGHLLTRTHTANGERIQFSWRRIEKSKNNASYAASIHTISRVTSIPRV